MWLMKADPSLPSWGGWSAPPSTTGRGRATTLPQMIFVALCLTKWRIGTHVCRAYVASHLIHKQKGYPNSSLIFIHGGA
jgi:hypothetical protein